MNPVRTILFPTDFSKAGMEMVPYVKEMAVRFGAGIIVLHAFDLLRDYVLAAPYATTYGFEETSIPYTQDLQSLRDERQERLETFARAQFCGLPYIAKIEDGNPAALIELVARSEDAGLIVMPTKGLGTFRRLLLGSVTAKVLHDVGCPVLTSAHEPGPALTPTAGFRSIVCAVELNREEQAVLEAAAFLAQMYQARLCIVHMESNASPESDEQALAESVRQAYRSIANAAGGEAEAGAKVRILDAAVPEGVRNTALEERADLVIVGRGHEKGNLSRMWSQLYAIIRESPCPVLSVSRTLRATGAQ